MSDKKNALEDFILDYLDRNLKLKFDICTCEVCRRRMMDYLLVHLPVILVDQQNPESKEISKMLFKKYFIQVFNETNKAIGFVSTTVNHPLDENKEKAFENLVEKIKEVRGVDFSLYHRSVLKRRIALRLAAQKVNSYTEYLKILELDHQEFERLFDVLTVNVSEFFRDPPVWLSVGRILRQILETAALGNEAVNIWSAGCANGEEPYSLAMLCRVVNVSNVPVKIFATDIDLNVLAKAKEGIYTQEKFNKAVKNVKDFARFELHNYFVSEGREYRVSDEIKPMVEFSRLDFVGDQFLKNIDLILCRNVFIYFTKALQEQILDRFYHSLKPGGHLVIGRSETLMPETRLIFKEIDPDAKMYKRVDTI